jgi:hypothetical protein
MSIKDAFSIKELVLGYLFPHAELQPTGPAWKLANC